MSNGSQQGLLAAYLIPGCAETGVGVGSGSASLGCGDRNSSEPDIADAIMVTKVSHMSSWKRKHDVSKHKSDLAIAIAVDPS